MSHGLQLAIIGLLVAWSGVALLRRLAPRAAWQAQARLSYAFEKPGRPAWLRRVGFALRPPMKVASPTCGTRCGDCAGCPR